MIRRDLQAALDKAFKEDTGVLVEEFITGREFTVGVFKECRWDYRITDHRGAEA